MIIVLEAFAPKAKPETQHANISRDNPTDSKDQNQKHKTTIFLEANPQKTRIPRPSTGQSFRQHQDQKRKNQLIPRGGGTSYNLGSWLCPPLGPHQDFNPETFGMFVSVGLFRNKLVEHLSEYFPGGLRNKTRPGTDGSHF